MKIARLAIVLLVLAFTRSAFGQVQAFDVAAFVAPRGWNRTESPGFALLQDSGMRNGHLVNCQIYVFASGESPASPAAIFQSEWNVKIVQALRLQATPNPQMQRRPDGWKALTSFVDALQNGVPYRTILYTATGSGRFISIVANYTVGGCEAEIASFFQSLQLRASPTPPSAAPRQSAISPPAAGGAAGAGLDNYVYTAPD